MNVKEISIDQITKGRNPRKRFDAEQLQELAQSIQEEGLLQPIVVEPTARGTYLLVMGERRLRAHELLKRTTIKALIRDRSNHNGRERFMHAIIENDQRVDMSPMERARAYLALKDEYGMSVRDISIKTGKRESTIGNLLLLTGLDEEIQGMIDQGFWKDPRVARGLLQIEDRTLRVGLAERLFKQRVSLKGCLVAVKRTMEALHTSSKKHKTMGGQGHVPILTLAKAEQKPLRWDAVRQLGKVPEWELIVHAAAQTCEACPLRDIASEFNCSDCASVFLLRRLMEAAQ